MLDWHRRRSDYLPSFDSLRTILLKLPKLLLQIGHQEQRGHLLELETSFQGLLFRLQGQMVQRDSLQTNQSAQLELLLVKETRTLPE